MAQSSAAREPTMEEILASIRRIIESNDESAPPRAEQRPQLASIAGSAPLPSEAPASLDTATITEAPRAEPEKPAAAAPARAISLADVAARLRSRDERPAPAPRAEEPHVANDDRFAAEDDEPVEPQAIATAPIDPFDAVFEDEAEEPATSAAAIERLEQDGRAEPAEREEAPAPAAASRPPEEQRGPVFAAFAARDSQRAEAAPPDAHATPRNEAAAPEPNSGSNSASALISTETGTKVAAAFDDLNSAIAEGRMRSFEELAQELLRPMLSEWLDDNLPTLVERLVREEIERVARGGRR